MFVFEWTRPPPAVSQDGNGRGPTERGKSGSYKYCEKEALFGDGGFVLLFGGIWRASERPGAKGSNGSKSFVR